MDLDRIETILQKECRFDKHQPLIVGVSGGPDSLCLLHVLHGLGYAVQAAHFDHHLRDSSGADAEVVCAETTKLGAPFHFGEEDVRASAAAHHLSIEEAARTARYRFLFRTAREARAQGVAVAHTADDQVETVLMHLLRGSGLAGLKGMQACTRLPQLGGGFPLARPLLETWREETVAYCREHELDPVIDPSNADTTFFRNRLRHELIPILQGYNPRVKQVLLRTASSLAGDHAFLEEAAQAAWDAGSPSRGEGYSAVDREAFLRLPVSLQRRVLRRMVADLRPELRDIDYETVERGVGFFREPPATFHLDLADGLDLDTQLGWVVLHEHGVEPRLERWPCLPAGTSASLEVPGSVDLGAGWVLDAGLGGQGMPEGAGRAGPNQAWLDAGRIRLPLTVRCRADGDRFSPFGMGGRSVKLSDYFINMKIPRAARATWPLVFAGEELAWVPGYRSSEAFRVSSPAGPVIHLVLRKK